MSRLAPILVVAWSFAPPVLSGHQEELTAGQILQKLGERYAALRSYHDTGEVLEHWPQKPGPDRITFETFFVRPDRRRFDWTSHHPHPPLRHRLTRSVIWSDGTDAYLYIDFPNGPDTHVPDRYYRLKSWGLADAGATGVSGGSSTTVFSMLASGTPVRMEAAAVVGSETFEGVDCYRLRGLLNQLPAEVWIGKEDWLLRKLARLNSQGMLTEEIRRPDGIDPEIHADVFTFLPPAEAGRPTEK